MSNTWRTLLSLCGFPKCKGVVISNSYDRDHNTVNEQYSNQQKYDDEVKSCISSTSKHTGIIYLVL